MRRVSIRCLSGGPTSRRLSAPACTSQSSSANNLNAKQPQTYAHQRDCQTGTATESRAYMSHGGPTGDDKSRSSPARRESSRGSSQIQPQEQVVHDRAGCRFTLDLGNNRRARIDYKSIGANRIEMYHTEVPVQMRGHGIGRTLAKGALKRAGHEGIKVKLTCSFLINYFDKYADDFERKVVEK